MTPFPPITRMPGDLGDLVPVAFPVSHYPTALELVPKQTTPRFVVNNCFLVPIIIRNLRIRKSIYIYFVIGLRDDHCQNVQQPCRRASDFR